MFGFFKKKIKDVVDKFSKGAEEEEREDVEEKKPLLDKIKDEPVKKKKISEEEFPSKEELEEVLGEPKKKDEFEELIKQAEEEIEDVKKSLKEETNEEVKKEKKSLFKKFKEKITAKKISEEKFEKLFWDLEVALMENNVATEVIDKIKESLKMDLVDVLIKNVKKIVEKSLRDSLDTILEVPKLDIIEKIKKCKKEGRPCVFLILGYNGSGKSVSCAKLAYYLKKEGFKPILAAGDTFRAAGSIQLGEYGKKVNVPVIKTEGKADSCALIFDAVKSAKAKDYDVVIADTAGRIHSNTDLMDELKKIVKVNEPDLKILVLDALTGADVVEQCRQFDKSIGVDALIFTKIDAYEKAGGLLSATYILDKPIIFIGYGQQMGDLKLYDKEEIIKNLGF